MQKNLIIQLARFGDILQTKRLYLSLAQKGHVSFLVDKSMLELTKQVYPNSEVFGIPAFNTNIQEIFTKVPPLLERLKGFDAVYPLNFSLLCQSITNAFDPEILQGYSRIYTHSRQSLWVQLAFRWMKNRKTTSINLADFWAGFAPDLISPLLVNPQAKSKGKGLGVVLSGQKERRSLSAQDYARIIHATFERLESPHVFLFGTDKEMPFARKMLSFLPSKVKEKMTNLAGKTNWQDLEDALTGLDLLLSPDTGTAHFAAHLGVPVEGFYFSSAWAMETAPYGLGHKIWQTSLACSPCLESAPCLQKKEEIPLCHTNFSSPAFLLELQGKTSSKHTLENIIPLESSFDILGQTYINKNQPKNEKQENLRSLLWDYINANKNITYSEDDFPTKLTKSLQKDDFLYKETDWILPQRRF